VDQSSSDFLPGTRKESPVNTSLSDFGYLFPFWRYSRSKSGVVWNRAEFCMFLAPNFSGGRAHRIFGRTLQRTPTLQSCGKVSRRSEEGARSCGVRKKTSAVKHKAFRTKAPFIATQLNSTRRRVELSCELSRFGHLYDVQLSWVELSCVASLWTLSTTHDADRRRALSGTQSVSAKQVSSLFITLILLL